MIRRIIIYLITVLLISVSIAAEENNFVIKDIGEDFYFTWSSNTEPDLAGYRLYMSTESYKYTFGKGHEFAEFGLITESPRYSMNKEGTFYFVLTAFDTEGFESNPSMEVYAVIINKPPKNVINLDMSLSL